MPQSSACAVVRAELGTETLSRLWRVRGKSTEEGLCPVSQRHWCSPRCVQGVRRFSLVSYQVLLLFCWSSNIPSWARAPWWSSQTCPNQALSSFLSHVFCGTFVYWPNKKASSYIQILELLLDCQIPKLCLVLKCQALVSSLGLFLLCLGRLLIARRLKSLLLHSFLCLALLKKKKKKELPKSEVQSWWCEMMQPCVTVIWLLFETGYQ